MKKGMTGNRPFRVAEHPEWGRPGADGAPDHSGPAAGQQPFYRKCLDLQQLLPAGSRKVESNSGRARPPGAEDPAAAFGKGRAR